MIYTSLLKELIVRPLNKIRIGKLFECESMRTVLNDNAVSFFFFHHQASDDTKVLNFLIQNRNHNSSWYLPSIHRYCDSLEGMFKLAVWFGLSLTGIWSGHYCIGHSWSDNLTWPSVLSLWVSKCHQGASNHTMGGVLFFVYA